MTSVTRRGAVLLGAALMLAAGAPAPAQQPSVVPVVAILIDDIGYTPRNDERTLRLPPAVGIAVLPRSPGGASAAAEAREQGRDVLLHQPLTARSGKRLGPGGIEVGMPAREMADVLGANLLWLGGAVGVNNHMGSAFTADPSAVSRLTHVLKESHRELFVIDSRTHSESVLESTARRHRLNVSRRNVFLDHVETSRFINRQVDALIREARENGTALGIGHPKSVTLDVLEARLASLPVKLVSVSELMRRRAAEP